MPEAESEKRERQEPINADKAYVLALCGSADLAEGLSSETQGAIYTAARLAKVKKRYLRDLDHGKPSYDDVAEAMAGDPDLVYLHLCAEMLTHEIHAARKVGKVSIWAAGMLTTLGSKPIDHLGDKLTNSSHVISGKIVHGITKGVHLPVHLAEEGLENAPADLLTAARQYLGGRYGRALTLHGAEQNAAWLWATLVAETADLPQQLERVPNYFADRLLRSISDSDLDIGSMPLPIRRLATHINNEGVTGKERGLFFGAVEEAKGAYTKKQDAELHRIQHGTRPTPELLAEIIEGSRDYHELLLQPYKEVEHRFGLALKQFRADNSPAARIELVKIYAVIRERHMSSGFSKLLNPTNNAALEQIVFRHLKDDLGVAKIAGGQTPTASLVAWRFLRTSLTQRFPQEDMQAIRKAHDSAAYQWFNHPYETFAPHPDITRFMRVAYLASHRMYSWGDFDSSFAWRREFQTAASRLGGSGNPLAGTILNSPSFSDLFEWADLAHYG